MIKVVKKKVNCERPFADIRDPQLKDYVMNMNTALSSMHTQVETLQDAVVELQRKAGAK